MSRSSKRLLARLGLLVVVAVCGCSPAIRVDVSGGWVGDITWTSGPATGLTTPLSLDLLQDGSDVSGEVTLTSHSNYTYTIPITFGRARSSGVEFDASGYNDQLSPAVPVTWQFDGTPGTTQMSGTGTATINGSTYRFSWDAVLVSPPAVES